MQFDTLLRVLVNGIANGAIYASIAVGFSIIYRSGKVMAEVKAELEPMAAASAHVKLMLDFLLSGKRPLARG